MADRQNALKRVHLASHTFVFRGGSMNAVAQGSRKNMKTDAVKRCPQRRHDSDKHEPRIPDRSRNNDPATDHSPSNNHLRSVTMNRQKANPQKVPIRGWTGRAVITTRRNRSKTSFEYSESSNELRMPFEVYPNNFELPIRLRAKNFGFLRILEGRSSNDFESLRMNPATSPA